MNVVYIVRTVVSAAHETEWLRWQEEEHVGNLLALPGYLGVHRFADATRPQHYLNLWRIESRGAQATDEYRRASLTPWFDRIRPHYEVSVTFSVETSSLGDDAWRADVRSAVIERRSPDSAGTAGSIDAGASDSIEAVLSRSDAGDADPAVVRVVRLAPLSTVDPADERSAASTVRVTFRSDGPQEEDSTTPPAGVERRRYRARGPYFGR